VPPTVEQNAEACGVDAATYVTEGPGLSAYIRSDGTVYRTYVTTARGLEPAMAYYGLLDRTPLGRHEEGEQVFWLRATRSTRTAPPDPSCQSHYRYVTVSVTTEERPRRKSRSQPSLACSTCRRYSAR
jgi:hypothetical protein